MKYSIFLMTFVILKLVHAHESYENKLKKLLINRSEFSLNTLEDMKNRVLPFEDGSRVLVWGGSDGHDVYFSALHVHYYRRIPTYRGLSPIDRVNTDGVLLTTSQKLTFDEMVNGDYPSRKDFIVLVEKSVSGRISERLNFRDSVVGEDVYMVGLPFSPNRNIHVSVGKVLSEEDSKQAVEDVQSYIKFDNESEFAVKGLATVGMSGGAVFSKSGDFLGVMYRGGSEILTRVVKAKYIISQLSEAFKNLTPQEADLYKKFLKGI